MEDHALSEDDEFWLVLCKELPASMNIYLVRVVPKDREIDSSRLIRFRGVSDKIAECTQGLAAQMTSLHDVVVKHLPDSSRLALPVLAVQIVNQRAEDGCVRHLAADDPSLYLFAAQEETQFVLQQPLHFLDETGALIVKDIPIVEGLNGLMFRVAKRGVHDGKEPRHN